MSHAYDRRLHLVAPLPAHANRFISLSEDLAPAWRAASPVTAPERRCVLLDLSVAEVGLSRTIRHARRFVADALPQAFRVNVDALTVTRDRAVLAPREPLPAVRRVQAELLAAAERSGLALDWHRVAVEPHVVIGRGYPADLPPMRIDGVGWRIEELRLVLGHGAGEGREELLDRWTLPETRSLAA